MYLQCKNESLASWAVVGFLDDDPAKSGKLIHGLKVYGSNGDLTAVCKQHEVDEVLISSTKMPEERLQEILDLCRTANISVKRMRITIEDLTEN